MWRPRITKADWDLDGKDDSKNDKRIQAAYREGHAREWAEARKLAPNLVFIGNSDNDLSYPEYKGKLQGTFLEALMGKKWSIETWKGWDAVMLRYREALANTSSPQVVVFNIWGAEDDFKFFRYAFTSCLLDNGYFSFTDEKIGYSSVPWFDEYDVNLGKALEPPVELPWKNGVYKREFEKGIALVNPGLFQKTVEVPPGYRHFLGKQDKERNNGAHVESVVLPGKDGVVLLRVSTDY
jgi:hypothetical protein